MHSSLKAVTAKQHFYIHEIKKNSLFLNLFPINAFIAIHSPIFVETKM